MHGNRRSLFAHPSGQHPAGSHYGSNTLPLISRSSIKRPISLSTERETIRDHFRTRAFRSRSKTIHSDTVSNALHFKNLHCSKTNLANKANNNTLSIESPRAFLEQSPRPARASPPCDDYMSFEEDEDSSNTDSSESSSSSSATTSIARPTCNMVRLKESSFGHYDVNCNKHPEVESPCTVNKAHTSPSSETCNLNGTVAKDELERTATDLVISASACKVNDCRSPWSPCAPCPSAHIPTGAEIEEYQRSLSSATSLVFHRKNGLPLTSSPAPLRKSGTSFDFDSSLTSVNAIKKALFVNSPQSRYRFRSRLNSSTPLATTSGLLGNFEESVLNGRIEPASIVNGFTAEIGASGSFCPKHKTLPVTVFFYTLHDTDKGDKMSSPYMGHINLGTKGYHIPRQGTVQVTLFNPDSSVVKMFVVRYNLLDMPPNSRTFLRQRTLFMPSDGNENDADSRKWLRYLIHLRFTSSKSGRIRLHTDMRILVFRKHDLDVATLNGGEPYELRSFVQMPSNPKYSKNIQC